LGYIRGDITNVSGPTVNGNIFAGPISITSMWDLDGNWVGATAGYGPGIPIGATISYSETGVLTLQDIWDFITGKRRPKLPPLKPMSCH